MTQALLNHFKRYNDEFGHQGGDELLTAAAGAWRDELRPEELLARADMALYAAKRAGRDRVFVSVTR